jgi:hypothetical protein
MSDLPLTVIPFKNFDLSYSIAGAASKFLPRAKAKKNDAARQMTTFILCFHNAEKERPIF